MQSVIMRGPRLWLVLGLGVLLALLGTAVSLGTAAQPNQDELAIRQVCRDAVNAVQTLPIPPPSYKGGVMPDSMVQEMENTVPAVLKNYYTDPILKNLTTAIQTSIRNERSGNARYLGGGVDSINFSKITVQNTGATATAQVATWQKMAQVGSDGKQQHVSTPHDKTTVTFTLVRVNGKWLISNESTPVPGNLL